MHRPVRSFWIMGVRVLHQICTQWFFFRGSAASLTLFRRKSWKSWWADGGGGGGGGESDTFSRHGVGVYSYITNLYNKQASKQAKKKKRKVFTSKREVQSHPLHPPPPPPSDGPDMHEWMELYPHWVSQWRIPESLGIVASCVPLNRSLTYTYSPVNNENLKKSWRMFLSQISVHVF